MYTVKLALSLSLCLSLSLFLRLSLSLSFSLSLSLSLVLSSSLLFVMKNLFRPRAAAANVMDEDSGDGIVGSNVEEVFHGHAG
jgi:hypothetical protein